MNLNYRVQFIINLKNKSIGKAYYIFDKHNISIFLTIW